MVRRGLTAAAALLIAGNEGDNRAVCSACARFEAFLTGIAPPRVRTALVGIVRVGRAVGACVCGRLILAGITFGARCSAFRRHPARVARLARILLQ
jgi:hypothetical protein